ncbi:SDR family oxidoreductase [Nakamurella sp. YIM 132087]|uniref:SDR family oxidoreductase n=1 Tax=Nakamurella alba TaxID=2665158 RepID=A0A7K1FNL7_9ACTN|nr:SDR family oxidoreductase [Nakamurella alba]MTD15736.1 SDR family oxidoreductase [Nakamurella alba]
MRGVLVTGASKGIGRAIAVAFAAAGDRVAVHYGGDHGGAATTLAALAGDGHVMVQGDLTDPDRIADLAAEADAAVGGIDVLVNNAAAAPSVGTAHPIDTASYGDWRRSWREMVEVNLFGAADLTFCVARRMIERGVPGRIVNVGSRGAFRGEPDFPAYGASKAALHAFGQSIAISLAPHGISVTSVAPGFVSTERQQAKLTGPAGDGLRGQSPFGRVGTPEEIAAAVHYLASPDAAWASGAVLDLNGASYLRT